MESNPQLKENKYKCKICGKSGIEYASVNTHFFLVHPGTGIAMSKKEQIAKFYEVDQ